MTEGDIPELDPDEYVMTGSSGVTGPARSKDHGGSKIFKAIADKTPRPRAKRMLTYLFGKGPRGGPDTAKAAQGLGVSRRTIQRWVSDGLPKTPRSGAAAQLRGQWQDSPAGRKASVTPARRQHIIGQGISGRMRGRFWISSDKRNGQSRWINVQLNAEQADWVYQGALENDSAAHSGMERALGKKFHGSVAVDIEELEID